MVCFCKCLPLVPVNWCIFKKLAHKLEREHLYPFRVVLNFICLSKNLRYGLDSIPILCSEKLSKRATQVCAGARSTD